MNWAIAFLIVAMTGGALGALLGNHWYTWGIVAVVACYQMRWALTVKRNP